jgi:hypothetical protein
VDGLDPHEWAADLEWHPLYRLWADAPMEYETYREQMRELSAEPPGWGLPEVWE